MKGKWQLCEDQGATISSIKHSKNKDCEVETNLGLFLGLEVGDVWLQSYECARSGDRGL